MNPCRWLFYDLSFKSYAMIELSDFKRSRLISSPLSTGDKNSILISLNIDFNMPGKRVLQWFSHIYSSLLHDKRAWMCVYVNLCTTTKVILNTFLGKLLRKIRCLVSSFQAKIRAEAVSCLEFSFTCITNIYRPTSRIL